ncbi:MAG: Ig-like domain-containing protein [Clostridia bacterium]|nr:Ig-like domain-containing protein [Clostridia bacterium]
MKRLLSILLCCIMSISALPALAENVEIEIDGKGEGGFSYGDYLGPVEAAKIGAEALIGAGQDADRLHELLALSQIAPAKDAKEEEAEEPQHQMRSGEQEYWLVNGKNILTETDPSFTFVDNTLYLHAAEIKIESTYLQSVKETGYSVVIGADVSKVTMVGVFNLEYLIAEESSKPLYIEKDRYLSVNMQLISYRDLSITGGGESSRLYVGRGWKGITCHSELQSYFPEFIEYTCDTFCYGKLELANMNFDASSEVICEELTVTDCNSRAYAFFSEGDMTIKNSFADAKYYETLNGNIELVASNLYVRNGVTVVSGDIIATEGSGILTSSNGADWGLYMVATVEGDIVIRDSTVRLQQDEDYAHVLYAGNDLIVENSDMFAPFYFIGHSSDIKNAQVTVEDTEFAENMDVSDPSVVAFKLMPLTDFYILDHDVVLQRNCSISGKKLIPEDRKMNLNGHTLDRTSNFYYIRESSFTPQVPYGATQFVRTGKLYFESNKLEYTIPNNSYSLGGIPMPQLTGEPSNATMPYVILSSSNKDVAYTDETGVAYLVGTGTTTITATALDGSNKRASYTLTVMLPTPATGVSFYYSNYELDISREEKEIRLHATVSPNNATVSGVTYVSSDPSIASVDVNGYVKGYKSGTVTITAYTNDGTNLSASTRITVKGELPNYKELCFALFMLHTEIFGDVNDAIITSDTGAYPPGTLCSDGTYAAQQAEEAYIAAYKLIGTIPRRSNQAEIDAALKRLVDIYSTFKVVPPLDFRALNSVVSRADGFDTIVVGTSEDEVASGSYFCHSQEDIAEFQAALEDAKEALVSARVQNEIDVAYKALAAACDKVYFAVARKPGDVDGNGSIEAADASKVLRFVVHLEAYFSDNQRFNADVDKNGEIAASDASKILRHIVKLENIEG